MQAERIDSLEKFRAMARKAVPPESAQDPKRAEAGELNWSADDGKWLKLFGGEPNEDNFWMWRELLRQIQRDEDTQVCFVDEKWMNPLHFVHVSNKDPMKVAYIPDPEKGKRDIYTVTTVGRYLTKYYGEEHLTALEIREWANRHREKWLEQQVQFTETEADCERVYTTGPSSCMSHSASHFGLKLHPARVYAGPDTALAYLTRDGKITARTVVNKHAKSYVRVYGDGLLATRLDKLGYTLDSGALDGVKLRYIEFMENGRHKAFLLPYLDGDTQLVDVVQHGGETYLHVTDGGAYGASSTNGYLRLDADKIVVCDVCGDHVHAGSAVTVFSGDTQVCSSCSDRYYVNAIVDYDGNRDLVHIEDVTEVADEGYYSRLDLTRFGFVYDDVFGTWTEKVDEPEEETPAETQQAA